MARAPPITKARLGSQAGSSGERNLRRGAGRRKEQPSARCHAGLGAGPELLLPQGLRSLPCLCLCAYWTRGTRRERGMG